MKVAKLGIFSADSDEEVEEKKKEIQRPDFATMEAEARIDMANKAPGAGVLPPVHMLEMVARISKQIEARHENITLPVKKVSPFFMLF